MSTAPIFRILFSLALYLSVGIASAGYQRDTVSDTVANSPIEKTVRTSAWKTLLRTMSQQVDSVKARLIWDPPILDTAYLDSAIQFFQTKQEEIIDLRTIVDRELLALQATPQEDAADSSLLVDVPLQDSVDLVLVATQDSLENVQNSLDRLEQEVIRLERVTREHRAEALNTILSPSGRLSADRIKITVRKNLIRDGSSVSFFDYPTWGNRVLIILLSMLYFYWIYRLGRKTTEDTDDLRIHKNEPFWIPLLKSCIFFLVLLPFSSFSVPILVLEGSYLVIFAIFFIILYRELAPFKRKVLLLIFLYFVLLIASNLILSEAWWNRAVAVIINLLGAFLVLTMGRRSDRDNPIGFVKKTYRTAIITGHMLGVLAILFGYIPIGRTIALAAGMGLFMSVSLRAFRDMITHDIEKQYERLAAESALRRFELNRVMSSVNRMLKVVNSLLVIIILLNIFDLTREARNIGDQLFATQHTLGGVSYKYGDVLFAIAILWLANWLQKTLKNILGDAPKREQGFKMALLPLFRLGIIIVAFLIAISVLGLGMDKLTVIIGALSVGIGLGLQNIINNFVSGIILVFEKPFKLGDYVELADKKGQVLEIGIRSSTLLTDQGARVTIPNGDLLSGRLVNWTFGESDIRMNMHLNVETPLPIAEVKKIIRKKLEHAEDIDHSVPIKVLTENVAAATYNLLIRVGIKDVRKIEEFRSGFLEELKNDLGLLDIKITSS